MRMSLETQRSVRIGLISILLTFIGCPVYAQNYFEDGKLNIDKQKYVQEFEKLQFDISTPTAGLFSKRRYCVRCTSGERLNCDVPVGGEAGRAMCGSYGMAKCKSSGGQVDYNGCP
jgi:hypothetical protein